MSIGGTLAALHGVIGALLALRHRAAAGMGKVIDVALYQAVFNCMESLIPKYVGFGAVRGPASSALPGIAPSNACRCNGDDVLPITVISAEVPETDSPRLQGDETNTATCVGSYVLLAGNGASIYKQLIKTIGRDDLGADATLADNAGHVARINEIDAAIGRWTAGLIVEQMPATLSAAIVRSARIYTVADIAADPHHPARGMLNSVQIDDGTVLAVPGICLKLSGTAATRPL